MIILKARSVNISEKFSTQRFRVSTINRKEAVDDFYSDRSRIIYCSSFRRLQQKAQVFSLEPNSSIRTRLTHSLEVSDLGRTLSNKIAYKLSEMDFISEKEIPLLVAIVENACLLHDIGNPPFGHFGESAIKEWAEKRLKEIVPSDINQNSTFDSLMADFKEFDGNPQGFRIITKLHTETDRYSLNLTYSTLLCALKYTRVAGSTLSGGSLRKAGYFRTEEEFVKKMWTAINMQPNTRYIFTYIMEAADDIAYCLSDIADGLEKGIITKEKFLDDFIDMQHCLYPNQSLSVELPKKIKNFSSEISVPWSRIAMEEAAENFTKNIESFYEGTATHLIPKDGIGRTLDIIKQVSRKTLYTSFEAESIELTGYAVITGILRHYEPLLTLSETKFQTLIKGDGKNGLDLERRLFNRIGKRYVRAYNYALDDLQKSGDSAFEIKEWWLRVHLIIDHITGMTDEFALNTYQMLEGIDLLKR